MVARIFVAPIANPQRAVGADLLADRTKPAIARREEIFFGDGLEAGAVGNEPVVIDGVLVNVTHENAALIFRRKLVALVNADAAVRRHVMFVLHDGRQNLVGVRIRRRARLPLIAAPGRDMEQMVNHACTYEGVTRGIEIHAPRIAGALGEDLELLRPRMIAGDRAGDLHPRLAGFGDFHLRMGEDAVRQVEPAVRSPGETVQQLVPVFQAETREQNLARVGTVVVVGVLEKQQIRGLTDIDAAVTDQNSGGQVQAVGKHGDLVRTAIVVRVFQNLDAIPTLLAGGCAERIFVKLDDPEPPAFVPGHRHRIDHIRLGGKEADLETVGHNKFLLRFGR